MAADVTDSESETVVEKDVHETEEIVSYVFSSDSRVTLNSEIPSIPEYDNECIPSHVIVQRQMKDVILSQKAAVQQIVRSNIDVLNTSKHNFNITYESQEDKIKQLEVSIQNDFVPKEAYMELKKKFQEECSQHGKTKAHLCEIHGQLSSSHHQLSEMEQKLEKEIEAHKTSCDDLQGKVTELLEQNANLQFLLTEKTLQCEDIKGQVFKQTVQIEKQSKKHEEERMKFKQKVTEAEVEKQQEAYLNRMLTEKNAKKKKP